jgi:hypothetical protein
MIAVGGGFAGLFLGVALAAFREYRDRSLHEDADVQAVLGVPPLAIIPEILTPVERRRQAHRTLGRAAATLTVLVVCAAVVLFTLRF